MQKIPAILKVRQNENEVIPKAIGVEIRKEVKGKICALLTQKNTVELLHRHEVDDGTYGQKDNIHFNTF